ncbi:hypothetical protein CEUSTIGMA_g1210.t1 [Chlamydomonas eustigma]|uniref:Glycosyltransferase family 92 protein n=1 Tax=Chlamydomonas eustigma TaxID=1157962 RepID=A0A250WST3_9CHLO|nr:hypothetical protein CEUSTIGMA_g1210.t1 [Chlamydomonas eustigma]|eukprot:GAX73759.1 hypothetical protein CEUSTIGMA_g1210.t1 [Chlamydomonas eustigma]
MFRCIPDVLGYLFLFLRLNAEAAFSLRQTYSALCAVARDENKYVHEWVKYHKCLGIGTIYLYDHGSAVSLKGVVQDYVTEGFVQYIDFNGTHTKWKPSDGFADNLSKFSATIQGQAYHNCLQQHSTQHTFMGFIDIDEFIVLYDKQLQSIDDLLKRYETFGGVSFYWRLLGSNGHVNSPSDSVIKAYQRCVPLNNSQNTQFKSFVNTAFKPTMYSPHRASFQLEASTSYLVDENAVKIASGRNKRSSHMKASVYHYATKSKQDFAAKGRRGGGAGVTRPISFLNRLDRACTETCSEALELHDRLCTINT